MDPSCVPIHICRERNTEIKCMHVCWGGGGVISRAAAFVSAAPRLWQIHRACGIRGLASLAMLTADTFHTALPLTAPLGSISPTVGEWLAGGGRERCLLCKGSSLPLLSLFLPPPLPSHFHLTHGSSRSHHLTTPSSHS